MAAEELIELRDRINQIDAQILDLFQQRMRVVAGIAAYKRDHGMPVFDPVRERENIERARRSVPADLGDAAALLQEHLMEAARSLEHQRIGEQGASASHHRPSDTGRD
jgi:chorismate mutase/prephenate dehydratase